MKNNFFRAFSERSFLFLWLSEVFTQIAINVFSFYLVLTVYTLTQKNTAVAGVVVSFTLPAILFGILAGVYVDRWNKKQVLFATNIIRATLLLLLLPFFTSLGMIYVISFLIAVVTQFFIPAESPMIPLVVKKELLLSANALFGLGIYGSILIAYVLSGPMIIQFGHQGTLFFLILFLIISSLFVTFIRTHSLDHRLSQKTTVPRAVLYEIREVLAIMSKEKEIHHSLFFLALSQILILVVSVVAPGYATSILEIKVEDFPMLFVAPAALGVVVGAFLLINIFENLSKDRMISFGLMVSGCAIVILPFLSKITNRAIVHAVNEHLPHIIEITTNHLVVLIAFFLGLANALVFAPANTILQEKSTDELRGKIYGVLNTIVGVFSLLPIIIVGGLSDWIGIPRVLMGIGICLLLVGVSKVLFKF